MMKVLLLILFYFFTNTSTADSTNLHNFKLKRTVVWSANLGIPVTLHTVLYSVWYAPYPSTKFHFVNDNQNWNQMDKVGHSFSSYFITCNSAASFRYAGYTNAKSAWLGAAVSIGFQSAIEYFDGRSTGWGASSGDIIANTVGTAFGAIQAGIWGKVKIPMCVTFQNSQFSKTRPELLGSTFLEKKLKDYNAQTYWVNINPYNLGIENKFLPKWLGISLGYSANGMLGGDDNVWDKNGKVFDYNYIQRQRQYYVSPTICLSHIKSRYKIVKFLFHLTEHWKLPTPALEVNHPGNVKFHWIYW